MLRTRPQIEPKAYVPAFEVEVASAGLALACAYSSSDEYEAEIVRLRRAAGVYGPRRQRRQAAVAFAIAAVIASFAILVSTL